MAKAKNYKGSLTLEWYNKQKSILLRDESDPAGENDIPAPRINWINREEALFYEINEEEGKGIAPYWVDRSDIRVKEARPLIFQKVYTTQEKDKEGTIPGTEKEYEIEESDEDDPGIENILIKGDNLLALNALKKHFDKLPDEEKVKCIYIDPPYNTGSAFEHYDDNLEHSEWLTLMRDRLVVMRDLLSESGSIWISVDDDESHYLKILCDEIFSRNNFVANVIWEKKYSPQNDAKWMSDSHDHILVYAKNKEIWRPNLLPRTAEMNKRYKNIDNDYRGHWKSSGLDVKTYSKEYDYPITTPSGRIVNPPAGYCWRVSKKKFKEMVEDNRIWFGESGNNVPSIKRFLSEVQDGLVSKTLWFRSEVDDNQKGKREVKVFNNKEVFATPKPERLICRILTLATSENDLALDCFAGSGTTLAVAQKMNRRWIGVEVGNHADTHIIPRLQKVISGKDQGGISKAVEWQGGGSFKYCHVGQSIISIDKETGKGEFNWSLGKKFVEESLLISYDFVPDSSILRLTDLFGSDMDQPTIGVMTNDKGKRMYGVAWLVAPGEHEVSINFGEFHALCNALKKLEGTKAITVFTNKGIDVKQDTLGNDIEIIKVPHAIFASLER